MSSLKAPLARRQAEARTRANAAAASVDRVLVQAWHDLLRLMDTHHDWYTTFLTARELWRQTAWRAHRRAGWHLERLARWGYGRTARLLTLHVPQCKLARVLANNLEEGRGHARAYHDRDRYGSDPTRADQGCRRPLRPQVPSQGSDQAGQRSFSDRHRVSALDLYEGRSPGLLDLLFPPLDADLIQQIVYGGDWQQALASMTRLAPPEQIASILASGLSQGKSQQAIAQDLLPMVNNVRTSAKRTSRTAGMRVAQASQMACYDQLGDLVIGYQVHSAFKYNSREWHKKRSGTIYWKEPQAHQKGLYQMPNPPDEPADPRERPPGTLAIAPNCLCFLLPVLS